MRVNHRAGSKAALIAPMAGRAICYGCHRGRLFAPRSSSARHLSDSSIRLDQSDERLFEPPDGRPGSRYALMVGGGSQISSLAAQIRLACESSAGNGNSSAAPPRRAQTMAGIIIASSPSNCFLPKMRPLPGMLPSVDRIISRGHWLCLRTTQLGQTGARLMTSRLGFVQNVPDSLAGRLVSERFVAA